MYQFHSLYQDNQLCKTANHNHNMKSYWIFEYFLLHCIAFITCESYYSIIAPGLMKSNHKYTVAISLYDADEPCSISISILGVSYNASERVDLKAFETKLIEFYPPKLLHGDYKLIAEGLAGIRFKNESILHINSNAGPKIYIQTDKAIYKPQDLVQFRVVILDEHTRPVHIREPIRVDILDHQSNRVKQFKDIKLIKGVYTGKFQLSEQPVLGQWGIKVTISGKYAFSKVKSIKVDKYVLPKFSVFIETAKSVLFQEGDIKAIIYGKYTFGKHVKGNVTVELWDTNTMNVLQEKQLEIKTSVAVVFDTKRYTKSQFEYVRYLKIVAKLTEQHTGITQTYDVYVDVHQQHYSILIPNEDIEFRHNKPFRLKVHIQHWTGAAVFDPKTPVVMVHGEMMYESNLDRNGVALFEFEHQADSDFKLRFKDSNTVLPNIYFHDSFYNSNKYCKLTLLGERPRLGKLVEIEVSSISDIPYLVYTVVGHASILRMEYIMLPPSKNKYIIQLRPSIEMVPHSFIYVHYVHNGNLRYEELKLSFPHVLENQISVIAPKQVRPGQEVTIELRAQPDSYVSILAVDLGVYLLDSRYDIYKSKVIQDLIDDTSFSPIMEATVYPGVISGLITLTNAHFPLAVSHRANVGAPTIESLRFRTKFPETWIFQNIQVNNTSTKLTLNIPDTVTTWRITAFSNNEVTGFGVVDGPTDITTTQPFFVTLNLPYSVKRGELVKIAITVFNYHSQAKDTKVILYNLEQEFDFVDGSQTDCQQQMKKQINVPSDGGETVFFRIKPRKLGEINLLVSATSSNYSDAVQQKLKVEPDGVTRHHSQGVYLSVAPGETLDYSFNVTIPADIVSESEYITISVGGNFLVPSIENLNDLVQMPTGCGEQNMVNFAPNILIIQYLRATGQYYQQKDLVKNAKSYIEIGYQQQLSFRHQNGGYSVFGESSNTEASSWLTAYVARFFIKASKYSSIESSIIESSMDFLAQHQFDDGEFAYSGYLFNPVHQTKYGFTAFVLLTFLEDTKYSKKYRNTIQIGLQYLTSNLDNVKDIYSLAVIATALGMAKHNSFHNVVDKIKEHSKTDKGLMWWTANDKNIGNDVEITSYILMALLDTTGDHRPILKWLIEQQNAQGGFKSTLDTVVGLQALVKYSEKVNNRNDIDLMISYSATNLNGREVKRDHFKVDLENMLILQKHKLPSSTRHISLKLNGTGHSLMQLSHQYNDIQEESVKHFHIKPKASHRNEYELDLEICFTYLSILDINNITNMVILEANLPSGYRSEAEFSQDLLEHELILRIESNNDESTIILYFDYLIGNVEYCVNIAAQKINDIAMRKPVAISMYDYYNLSRSNTVFYNI